MNDRRDRDGLSEERLPLRRPRPKRTARNNCPMIGCSTSARDALARSDVDPASVMMVRSAKVGVVCPVANGNCGWPQNVDPMRAHGATSEAGVSEIVLKGT